MKELELFNIEDKLKNQVFNLANIHDVLYKQVPLNKEFGNIRKTTVGAVLETLEASMRIIKNNCDELTEIRGRIFHSNDYENDYLFETNSKCFNVIDKCFVVTQEFAWYDKGVFFRHNSPKIFTSFNKAKEFVEKMTVGTVLLNREKKNNDFVYRVISNKNNDELIRYTICECKLNKN